jgi:hypothetical protein
MSLSRRALLQLLAPIALGAQSGSARKTRNVFYVMTDGLRWQEVFRGADAALMNKESGGVADGDIGLLRAAFWRETAAERRRALMPFTWTTIAGQGQIFGNRDRGSDAYVSNGLNFSYPGYNEALCGFADPRINSNDKKPNPNVTVLEWLHSKAAFKGKVAAFAAWDTFPYIFNAGRAGFPVNAGYDLLILKPASPNLDLLNRMKDELPRYWAAEPFDALTFHTALEYLKQMKPRVFYLSLGETDEWSHAGNYAQYLYAARRVDRYLKQLWDFAQAAPEYRGSTSLIVTTDHGRGEAPVLWKSHGEKHPDSKYIWMTFLGPDTRALGERTGGPAVVQNQIAATLAALLGENYNESVPRAGQPVAGVVAQ